MYQKWLEAFHHVALEGGFTAAARRLNVGQPTISSHVSNLEARFGVELFHRRGRTVKLTAAGQTLFEITHDLYGHEQEAIAYLASVRKFQAGELRFSAVGPFDVMDVLSALREKRPGIRCSVRLGLIEEVLTDLEDFRADIGVVGRDSASATIHSVFYAEHRVLVIVNRHHRLAGRKSIQLKELNGEEMVVRTSSSTTQTAFDNAAAAAGIAIDPVFRIESREGLREAIVRGLGIGVISETEFSPHPELRALTVSDAEMSTRAYVTCLKSRRNRPLISEALAVASRIVADRQTVSD
jgi:aminoethylphosphonate catabolism LysR family transcriptional regulator